MEILILCATGSVQPLGKRMIRAAEDFTPLSSLRDDLFQLRSAKHMALPTPRQPEKKTNKKVSRGAVRVQSG